MLRCLIRRNINRTHIPLTAVHWSHLHTHTRRRDTLYIIHEGLAHLLVVLVGYESATDFGICFAGQYGLTTFARVATPYAADIKRWTAGVALQSRIALLTESSIYIYRLAICLLGEWNLLDHLAFRLWNR